MTGSISAANSPYFSLTWRWYGVGPFTINNMYVDINLTLGIPGWGVVNAASGEYQFTNVTVKGFWRLFTGSLTAGLTHYHVFENQSGSNTDQGVSCNLDAKIARLNTAHCVQNGPVTFKPKITFDDTQGGSYTADKDYGNGNGVMALHSSSNWNRTRITAVMKNLFGGKEAYMFGAAVKAYIDIELTSTLHSGNWGFVITR